MTTSPHLGLVVSLLSLLLVTVPAASAPAPAVERERDDRRVTKVRVELPVGNVNRTDVACPSDGKDHLVYARLIGPERKLSRERVERVNVLVHDFTAGAWFWNLRRHPRFDYASRLAERGEVSLVVNRLGYDASRIPDGLATCLGAQADMLHQVVDQVRAGQTASGIDLPRARKVVVHGHSVGAGIAQLSAATFGDIDGLVLMSWTDSGATPRALEESTIQQRVCADGGDPPAYAPYGQTRAAFRELLFVTAPKRVQRAATQRRNPDPCGDATSLAQLMSASNAENRRIEVPVLLLFGEQDARNRPDSFAVQEEAYGPGAEVTSRTTTGAGSALPLERSAPKTRRQVLRWLDAAFG